MITMILTIIPFGEDHSKGTAAIIFPKWDNR